MSERVKRVIQDFKKTKEYVESLGYELGEYSLSKKKNVVLKDVNAIDGCMKYVGYIKCGDFNSLVILD